MNRFLPVIYLLLHCVAIGQQLSPENIFKKVSPSVVYISDIEGQGSGVVLTTKGTILTNYHVVASGMPISVKVKVKVNGQLTTKTFEKVKIDKVHKEYDLAIIKLDLKFNEQLIPIKQFPKNKDVTTGSKCFAIGHPNGLENTITQGLISSANRIHDKLKYYQISAAINPGNSGGPVCNDAGELIGIATWKFSDQDNIGFAIPTKTLDIKNFVTISDREPNLDLGQKYEQEAGKIYNLLVENRSNLTNDEYSLYIIYTSQLYKKSLFYMPNSPSPYHNLGLMYFELKKYDLAINYFTSALEKKPDAHKTKYLLAWTLKYHGKTAEAEKLWLEILSNTKDQKPLYINKAAYNLAESRMHEKKWAESVYYAKWSESVPISDNNNHLISNIKRNANEQISEVQKFHLSISTNVYSLKNLDAFLNLKDSDLAKLKKEVADQNNKLFAPSVSEEKNPKPSFHKPLPPEGKIVTLPESPGKIMYGNMGQYVFIHFPTYKKIGVYDVNQLRFIRYIDFDNNKDNFLWTAGKDHLVIYTSSNNIISVFSQKTWKKIREVKNPFDRNIASLHTDPKNTSRVLLYSQTYRGQQLKYLALKTGTIVTPQIEVIGASTSKHSIKMFSDNISLSGNTLLYYQTSYGCSALNMSNTKIELKPFIKKEGQNTQLTSPYYISSDGKYYFNGKNLRRVGSYIDIADFTTLRSKPIKVAPYIDQNKMCFLVSEEQKYYLKTIHIPSMKELASTQMVGVKPDSSDSYQCVLFASAHTNRAVFVRTRGSHKIMYICESHSDQSNLPTIQTPTPGRPYEHKVNIPDGTTASVETGPEGIVFDNKTNKLTWNIPIHQEQGKEVKIVLLLTSDDGEEDYKLIKIFIP